MISIAIVEDEKEFAGILVEYIKRYMRETHRTISVSLYQNGASFIDEYSGKHQIVFMDIAMPHMNGLDAARKLREKDNTVCLIFITSMAQYAIRGYEVAALDFILKPVQYELFKIKLDKAISHIKEDAVYTIQIPNGVKNVRLADLIYIESNKHYLYFHTTSDAYRMRGSMRDVRDFFEGKGFAFANGSQLVNLSYVEAVHGNAIQIAGETLSIARTYKADFWNKLTVFMSGGI